jgi:four helix bundle protein
MASSNSIAKLKTTIPLAAAPKFDLHDRNACFGEKVILFAKTLPATPMMAPLIPQLVRSGTSVGANYCEADDAFSKKEFYHRIGICRKEASESKYWLRMIVVADPLCKDEARKLWPEAKELHLIFAAIFRRRTSG